MGAGGVDAGCGWGGGTGRAWGVGGDEVEVYGDDLCSGFGVEDGSWVGELGELFLGCEEGVLSGMLVVGLG